MPVIEPSYGYEVSGDTAVHIKGPKGIYSIKYIGIGHPWHTITTEEGDLPRGRCATDAEFALARALIIEKEATRGE